MTAVDQINPILVDLYDSLCKISTLAPDWEGKVKLKNWYQLFENFFYASSFFLKKKNQI